MVVCITVTCVAAPTPGIEKNETCKSQHPLQGTNGLGRVPPLRRSGETSKPVKLEKKEREKGKKGGGGKEEEKKKKKKKGKNWRTCASHSAMVFLVRICAQWNEIHSPACFQSVSKPSL